MIHLVTNRPEEYGHITNAKLSSFDEFEDWINSNTVFILDTETLFVEDTADVNEERKLVLIQFGDITKENQWLIEANVFLTKEFIDFITPVFQDDSYAFITHNGMFEYMVIKIAIGARIENIHDTFLMSKILNTGYELYDGYHSLAGCLNRFFGIEIDKSEQTKFTFEPLTESQVKYAAEDVVHLFDLFNTLKPLLVSWNLWWLYLNVEREVIKVYGDMSINEMRFDSQYWLTMSQTLLVEDKEMEKELNYEVFKDSKLVEHLKRSNLILGTYLIQPKDTLDLNWASPVVRKEVLVKIIPDLVSLDKFSKPDLTKLFKANILPEKDSKLLKLYINREYSKLNRYLTINFKKWLVEKGYFKLKNTPLINWSSNPHKLYTFQFYYPNLQDTNAKTLKKIHINPLINKFKKYVKIHKNVTTYGENFIRNYVTKRGTISPHGCNSILNTGRISFSILLQMPAQAKYRNAFLPPKDDWVFVDSDYASVELVYAAYRAQEPAFLQAIIEGKDAHSMSAAKLFGDEWIKSAESNCVHLSNGSQCSCPEHMKLRTISKTITFGLLFGSTHVGISERLDISRDQGKKLVDDYFKTFPKFKEYFDKNAEFGMKNNYIVGYDPTNRIRFFHPPINDGEKQAIGRASMNMP